jgi:hypothetical protein
MRIDLNHNSEGGVLISGTEDELLDLSRDCTDAVMEGEDVVSQLINADGVTTFTVRCDV